MGRVAGITILRAFGIARKRRPLGLIAIRLLWQQRSVTDSRGQGMVPAACGALGAGGRQEKGTCFAIYSSAGDNLPDVIDTMCAGQITTRVRRD